nr:putative GH32 family protein [Cyphoderus albinus]
MMIGVRVEMCHLFFVFSLFTSASTFNVNQEKKEPLALIKQSTSCTTQTYRPRYHFSPSENWMNDPNGLVYYDGLYHLFFQYHPGSSLWGPMNWGHAISRNLVTWEELDIALMPDELGDIFSGSAVVDHLDRAGFKDQNSTVDPIVAIYTSASGESYEIQRQSLAYSIDNGITFQKYEHNPILEAENSSDFRDPKVFFHSASSKWIMSLAVGHKIEFYSSTNLLNWTKESEFGADPLQGEHGGVWECPDLIQLRAQVNSSTIIDIWVLLVSINPGYFIGNFSANRDGTLSFTAFEWNNAQWLDWGPDNYAGVTFSNEPSGRQIYIAWMSNWNYANKTPTRPWRGQMTIPRQLGVRVLNSSSGDLRLTSNPVPELTSLRHPLLQILNRIEFEMLPQTITVLTNDAKFKSPLMELEIDLEIVNNPQFSICAHNTLKEETCFGYNGTHWYIDRSKSGNFHKVNKLYAASAQAFATRETTDTEVTIRIFFDVSSIEVFADGGLTSMTALHFPTEPFDKLYIEHWSKGATNASLRVKRFKLWALRCWYSGSASTKPTPVFTLVTVFIVLLCVLPQ